MLICFIILRAIIAILLACEALLKHDARATNIVALMTDNIVAGGRVEDIAAYGSAGRIISYKDGNSWM